MSRDQPRQRWSRIAIVTTSTCALAAILVTGFASLHGAFVPTILWSFALTSVGWLLGFLFAFPRAPQRPPPGTPGGATDAHAAVAVFPDSMSEIADWLTKIIVGLGLVNLLAAPVQLEKVGALVARSMHPQYAIAERAQEELASLRVADDTPEQREITGSDTAPPDVVTQLAIAKLHERMRLEELASDRPIRSWTSFAQGFVIFHLANGLMLGYLVTRLYLLTALNHADREAEFEKRRPFPTDPADVYQESVEIAVRIHDALQGSAARAANVAGAPDHVAQATLRSINTQYCNVRTEDYNSRVVQKNSLMQQMFSVALAAGASRRWLADQPGDGFAHALATLILADPQDDDVELLRARAPLVDQRHAQYRVVEAFQRLAEARKITPAQADTLKPLLRAFDESSDGSLSARIAATLAVIDATRA